MLWLLPCLVLDFFFFSISNYILHFGVLFSDAIGYLEIVWYFQILLLRFIRGKIFLRTMLTLGLIFLHYWTWYFCVFYLTSCESWLFFSCLVGGSRHYSWLFDCSLPLPLIFSGGSFPPLRQFPRAQVLNSV